MVRSWRSSDTRTSSSLAPSVKVWENVSGATAYGGTEGAYLQDENHPRQNTKARPDRGMLEVVARDQNLEYCLQDFAGGIDYLLDVLLVDTI